MPGFPTTVMLPVPRVLTLLAPLGETAPPLLPVRVLITEPPVNPMVTVFPAPDVVMSMPPKIFKTLAAGIAVPESVTNDVGTVGRDLTLSKPS